MESSCGITRTLGVLSDPWTYLILRSSFLGRRTFEEFRDALGIAIDVLSVRLKSLVTYGIFEKVPYQKAGQRTRHAYDRTVAGQELLTVLISLQQWGDEHLVSNKPREILPVRQDSGRQIHVSLVDDDGSIVRSVDTAFVRTVTGSQSRPHGEATL
ncbi:helix-turn-helix domain-containing protein [Homoserinimonas sp. OAct 916]|uniref:winged helix-turn-helix transcriptional regulator n=1 Tax=Homoserinimonas sp. OAct 916 TaxID=2211450 RepID=UPI000DBE6C85|nr:helix-turn-helix domain-containing protein [Homoserinimonas sp. OAct 916]